MPADPTPPPVRLPLAITDKCDGAAAAAFRRWEKTSNRYAYVQAEIFRAAREAVEAVYCDLRPLVVPQQPQPSGPRRTRIRTSRSGKPTWRTWSSTAPVSQRGTAPMADPLFELPPSAPLTAADIDEWIANINSADNPHSVTHAPNEWARAGLGALLGEDIPYRRWTPGELLTALTRARRIAARA